MSLYFHHPLGEGRDGRTVRASIRRGAALWIYARPRYGKGGVAKPLLVKYSKQRSVLFFDYGREWAQHVTKYNRKSRLPDKMVDVRVAQDFTFKISQFDRASDFVALGFSADQCMMLAMLVRDTQWYHQDDTSRLRQILRDIPAKEKGTAVMQFNIKYGTRLDSPINWATKNSIITRFTLISHWFWQGTKDSRPVIDFEQFWGKECRNLIINLRFEGGGEYYARAWAGKILQQIRPTHVFKKPVIGFEESRVLFPAGDFLLVPTSVTEGYDLVTLFPKKGVNCVFIAQDPSQLAQQLRRSSLGLSIVGRLDIETGAHPQLRQISEQLRSEEREFAFIDENGRYTFFAPGEPCCQYESDA